MNAFDVFDLIQYQQYAREKSHPKDLFKLWEEICHRYDRGWIGPYELEEMKAVIWPKMKELSALKRAVDMTFRQQRAA